MPMGKFYKSASRKSYKKKTPRKKYRKQSNLRVPGGMPRIGRARLRYVELSTITGTSGALSTTKFRAGGVFDPRFASGGHQPMAFDQWASLFNHYVTVGSKCTVTFSPNTDVNTMVGVYVDSTTTTYNSWIEFAEAKMGYQKMIADDERTKIISVNYSAKKFFNLTDIKDNVTRLGAAVTENPDEDAFFIVYIQATDEATTVVVQAKVQIDYIVDFSEPKSLAQS